MSARAVTLWLLESDDPAGRLRERVPGNDHEAAAHFAQQLLGDAVLLPFGTASLPEAAADPDPDTVYVGWFGGLTVLCWAELGRIPVEQLPELVPAITEVPAATVLIADPAGSLGSFARWERGELRREFTATPVQIVADTGLPFLFEGPFWSGEHPLHYAPGVPVDPLALPFHPLELAEEANRSWLGFRFTHPLSEADLDPASITVSRFGIRPPGYQPTAEEVNSHRPAAAGSADDEDLVGPEPDEADTGKRTPGPLSRFFGFRGRL